MKKILVQVTQFVRSVLLPLHKLSHYLILHWYPSFWLGLGAEPQEFYFGEAKLQYWYIIINIYIFMLKLSSSVRDELKILS